MDVSGQKALVASGPSGIVFRRVASGEKAFGGGRAGVGRVARRLQSGSRCLLACLRGNRMLIGGADASGNPVERD
jgi:hypothetical protein